jgi:hypothetical protein
MDSLMTLYNKISKTGPMSYADIDKNVLQNSEKMTTAIVDYIKSHPKKYKLYTPLTPKGPSFRYAIRMLYLLEGSFLQSYLNTIQELKKMNHYNGVSIKDSLDSLQSLQSSIIDANTNTDEMYNYGLLADIKVNWIEYGILVSSFIIMPKITSTIVIGLSAYNLLGICS